MAPLAARYHVFAPDLPGFGRSAASGPFTLARGVDAVVEVIRRASAPAAHICGLSLGAMLAVEVALQQPRLVASLTLSGGQIHPNPLLMRVQSAVLARMSERALIAPPALLKRRYPELAPLAEADARATGKAGFLAAMSALSQVDTRKRLGAIAAPSLVLCGARDWANKPAARALARAIPGAELRTIPHAGHVWNLERPDLFNQILLEFLQRVAR
jgi:pimeloyl-ACP methyl ester carboxylesterase